MISGRARICAMGLAMAVLLTTGPAAFAQAQDNDARIRKMEAEVRALQRKVFPGGDGRFFTPEVSGAAGSAQANSLPPATTATTDILARLDALESQFARLTSQVETNTNALALLTGRIAALEPETAQASVAAPGATTPTSVDANRSAMTGGAMSATRKIDEPVPAVAPSPERLAAVQAIAKPSTGDAGEDEYVYGFRLWEAGFYPEAQQQLRLFVDKYPSHWRISYGRNLLGRAYLDDGKPAEAAPWLLKNYEADKLGVRAGDSLLYLAQAMIAQKDTKRACIALAEFGDTYPALAAGRLHDEYEANRRKVKCN